MDVEGWTLNVCLLGLGDWPLAISHWPSVVGSRLSAIGYWPSAVGQPPALLDHYHLHCLVTGGGLTQDGARWVQASGHYLFSVRALSAVFGGKFCAGLEQLYAGDELQFHGQLQPLADEGRFREFLRQAARQKWVVYAKPPFAGPATVLAYLSRYTHRVAISPRRLLALDEERKTVTFAWKDYAQGARRKTMTLG